ncbi:MAG TPA: MarR family transcriptional regulator [Steroidobacteraceae bacterium]|nr:MarR family transcriptional regulator [Steroidobacteraceae bacterium]
MDLFKNVGYLLKDVSRRYVARFERHAAEVSLTLMQCKVLLHLSKNEGASQVRLCELTDVEPMMMVRILDRMEADKLLERRPHPADRRARRLYLTRKAAPILDEIDRISEVTRNEIFAGVGKADREAFLKVLQHAHENACGLEAATQADAQQNPVASRRRARAAAR